MNSDLSRLFSFSAKLLRSAALAVCLLSPILGFYLWGLYSVGELCLGGCIAKASQAEKILWQSAYNYRAPFVKWKIASTRRPRVIAVGSSRVMQFRSQMFHKIPAKAFYNIGGGVAQAGFDGLITVKNGIRDMISAGAKPELILLGIDHDWCGAGSPRKLPISRIRSLLGMDLVRRIRDFRSRLRDREQFAKDLFQLFQIAWTDERFYKALFVSKYRDPRTGRRLIGVASRLAGGGFRNDGSYHYHSLPSGNEEFGRHRSTILGARFVEPLCRVFLREIASLSQKNKIELLVHLTPLKNAGIKVYESAPSAMRYRRELERMISGVASEFGFASFNFLDARDFGSNDREFRDMRHIGEIGAARLVLKMAEDERTRALMSRYVNMEKIRSDIAGAKNPLFIHEPPPVAAGGMSGNNP